MFLHFLITLVLKQSVHHDDHLETLGHNHNHASLDRAQVGGGGLLLYHCDAQVANDHVQNPPWSDCLYFESQAILDGCSLISFWGDKEIKISQCKKGLRRHDTFEQLCT